MTTFPTIFAMNFRDKARANDGDAPRIFGIFEYNMGPGTQLAIKVGGTLFVRPTEQRPSFARTTLAARSPGVRAVGNPSQEGDPTMINILAFLTLFLAIFTPCVVLILKWEQTKDLKAWDVRQRANVKLESEAAWRRNKQMRMD